mgnify:CR=1 FL=1
MVDTNGIEALATKSNVGAGLQRAGPTYSHPECPHAHVVKPNVADIWLFKSIQICLRTKIPTKNLHEWGLGEADRAEI